MKNPNTCTTVTAAELEYALAHLPKAKGETLGNEVLVTANPWTGRSLMFVRAPNLDAPGTSSWTLGIDESAKTSQKPQPQWGPPVATPPAATPTAACEVTGATRKALDSWRRGKPAGAHPAALFVGTGELAALYASGFAQKDPLTCEPRTPEGVEVIEVLHKGCVAVSFAPGVPVPPERPRLKLIRDELSRAQKATGNPAEFLYVGAKENKALQDGGLLRGTAYPTLPNGTIVLQVSVNNHIKAV